MSYIKEVEEQLVPQIKRASTDLRMRIAGQARYDSSAPNHPYFVEYDCQRFYSNDTGDLVNQVVAWIKKPVKERAKDIIDRR